MSTHETATDAAKAKVIRPARTKAEQQRAH